jgi:putative effector of murein hydrolase
MKQRTRDNLIYLAVGLGIAALVVADFIYAQSHARKMWLPSSFSSRFVYTTALLGYFVIRETRRMKATTMQVLACVVFGSVVHVVIAFLFRQAFAQLPGISFSAFAVLEMFLVWLLTLQVARFLKAA